MKQVCVTFQYVGPQRPVRAMCGTLGYVIDSNNLPMGIALARNELWHDLHDPNGRFASLRTDYGVTRFDYKTQTAAFVATRTPAPCR